MEQPLNDDKPAGAASALTDVLEVVGVINELGNIEQAMKRKPWLSEKDDKAWRNWWYSRDCFEKVYRVKSNAVELRGGASAPSSD